MRTPRGVPGPSAGPAGDAAKTPGGLTRAETRLRQVAPASARARLSSFGHGQVGARSIGGGRQAGGDKGPAPGQTLTGRSVGETHAFSQTSARGGSQSGRKGAAAPVGGSKGGGGTWGVRFPLRSGGLGAYAFPDLAPPGAYPAGAPPARSAQEGGRGKGEGGRGGQGREWRRERQFCPPLFLPRRRPLSRARREPPPSRAVGTVLRGSQGRATAAAT